MMLTGCDFYVYPTGIFQIKGNTDDKIWDETGFNHNVLGFPVYILNTMVILTQMAYIYKITEFQSFSQ